MTAEPPTTSTPRRLTRAAIVVTLLLLGALTAALTLRPAAQPATIPAELRSWIVAGRGRHLFLQILPPSSLPGAPDLAGRVEFTSASLRRDYAPPADPRLAARITRMSRGTALTPIMGPADNRLEALYELTPDQARALQEDRVFSRTYSLLGPNSNSGMARALRDAGLALPDRVAQGGGFLGEFPGIDMDPGEDIPRAQWRSLGIESPPTPAPAPSKSPETRPSTLPTTR